MNTTKQIPCDHCGDPIDAEIHKEELGMCIDCSNKYFTHDDEEGEPPVKDYYELLENPPELAQAVAQLWSSSSNYDYPSPATLFLDLIGYSIEHTGEPFTTMKQVAGSGLLGYLEIDMIADALKEYAHRPLIVTAFVDDLLSAEMEQ